MLAGEISQVLEPVAHPLVLAGDHRPEVILIVGVNGAGKTTTIGKLASKFKADGKSVVLAAGDTASALAKGGPYIRERSAPPVFAEGEKVRMANIHPMGHTRLPRYLRGKEGVVHKVRDAHVFPDTSAQGAGEDPQWLYSVRFKSTELWGEAANPRDHVHVDCWESYLERL